MNAYEFLYINNNSRLPTTIDASFCISRLWSENAVSKHLITLVEKGDFEMFKPYDRPVVVHTIVNNCTWLSGYNISGTTDNKTMSL